MFLQKWQTINWYYLEQDDCADFPPAIQTKIQKYLLHYENGTELVFQKVFAPEFKTGFKRYLRKAHCKLEKFNVNYYGISGFFSQKVESETQYFYFDLEDVRCDRRQQLLVRRVDNLEDYCGKRNVFIPFNKLSQLFQAERPITRQLGYF